MSHYRLVLLCAISLHIWVVVNTKPNSLSWINGQRLCNGKETQIPESYAVNETFRTCYGKVFVNSTLKTLKSEYTKSSSDLAVMRDQFPCVFVCQMQELELVDERGEMIEDEIDNFIKEVLPSVEAASLMTKFRECIKKFGNKVDTSGDCEKKSRDLVNCAKTAFNEVCKLEGVGYLHAGLQCALKQQQTKP